MTASQFIELCLEKADDFFLMDFLDIDLEELNLLWEEETLTDLQDKIDEAYQQMPEDELQKFIKLLQ